ALDEAAEVLLERGELEREVVDELAVLALHRAAEPPGAEARERLGQRVELLVEDGADVGALLLLAVERRAPDGLALPALELAEELDEALQEVGLGEEEVDGEADAEVLDELVHAGADGLGVALDLGGRGPGELVEGDADEDAVDGPLL